MSAKAGRARQGRRLAQIGMRGRRQGWLQLLCCGCVSQPQGRLASRSLASVWSAAAGQNQQQHISPGWAGAHRAAVPVVDGVKSAIWMSRQSITGMQAANAPRRAACQLRKRGPAGRFAMLPLAAGGLDGLHRERAPVLLVRPATLDGTRPVPGRRCLPRAQPARGQRQGDSQQSPRHVVRQSRSLRKISETSHHPVLW